MVKIAAELQKALQQRAVNGMPGGTISRTLASGERWSVDDVICTSGPQDRPFEEQHSDVVIAIVAAGSFHYRASSISRGAGGELMTPGALVLGNHGQYFECGHEHGVGDRCLAFRYAPDYFESLLADSGVPGSSLDFAGLRLPPLRELTPIVARALAGLVASDGTPWEEVAIQLAALAVQLTHGSPHADGDIPPSTLARITRAARAIEQHPYATLTLGNLAKEARLSPYHFLRVFERVTSLTPHQYILRARLRNAALRLATEPTKILDVAFDCGFGDLSNFNRAFRAEFGLSPRAYRKSA
ncbi:MAG TPA: AraC family transcriptional regulator [Candidatus Angelobacter sp.]|nr:AraC family transcriptional regulator [Candidatus Angelobacter sp.]